MLTSLRRILEKLVLLIYCKLALYLENGSAFNVIFALILIGLLITHIQFIKHG